jgi:RNA polymerase sigma factor (TIGR02999 family)
MPLVHDELHRIARRYMRMEPAGHTLQTTALVNEAYLRVVDQDQVRWQDRAHFFGIAARLMRQILVDHARAHHRHKRGGGDAPLPLDEAFVFSPAKSSELVALDDALNALGEFDARKARVVEMRFFGGMSVEETAEALGVHPNTVIRDWDIARRWLRREMART